MSGKDIFIFLEKRKKSYFYDKETFFIFQEKRTQKFLLLILVSHFVCILPINILKWVIIFHLFVHIFSQHTFVQDGSPFRGRNLWQRRPLWPGLHHFCLGKFYIEHVSYKDFTLGKLYIEYVSLGSKN